jgi:hypothetical protein
MGLTRHGYLLARRYHWLIRQNNEQTEVDALRIPAEVRKPESFNGVAEIDAVQHRLMRPVPNAQGRYRAGALTIYVAPAIAVLFVGLQQAGWPTGFFAAGLVFSQAVLVLFVFLRIIIDRKPTATWIERRARSELIRREQYLCLARVGPYHDATCDHPISRIAWIESASLEGLGELVPMEHSGTCDRPSWIEHMSSLPQAAQILIDLPERIASYQYYRAGKQIAWMRSSRRDSENSAKVLTWLLGTVAISTILLAGVNAIWLLTLPTPAPETTKLAILTHAVGLSVFLPAFSGTVLALQGVFNLRFLIENYRSTERALELLRGHLMALQDEIAKVWFGTDDVHRRELQHRFQKLVLRVEAVLTDEYLRWQLITQRDAHELG